MELGGDRPSGTTDREEQLIWRHKQVVLSGYYRCCAFIIPDCQGATVTDGGERSKKLTVPVPSPWRAKEFILLWAECNWAHHHGERAFWAGRKWRLGSLGTGRREHGNREGVHESR